MRSLPCLLLITCLLPVGSPLASAAGEPKPTAPGSQLLTADQLYKSGKFAEAEASYQALLATDPASIPAQVGVVRSMLRQQKIDEAFTRVNQAISTQPNSAALLAAKGDVEFRRGDMSAAEKSFLAAKKADQNEVHAYLGLSRLYSSYSLYRHAYDQLQSAHTIAPNDIEVQRAWLRMLPRKERIAALQDYLTGPHPDNEEETSSLREYLNFLQATADKPVHACKLVSKVEQTEAKLDLMLQGSNHVRGIGLTTEINHQKAHLLLDTGAGGIMISRRIADKAGVVRVSDIHYAGIGDKGVQSGYTAVADHIRIGELEFQDCVVRVTDARSVGDEDGLIGADVFNSYVVDLDLPAVRLKLSPLPKRPEDNVAPNSLNSEGEDQATAERKEESASPNGQQNPKPESPPSRRLPRDRYIAPEMAKWTRVFRFGHFVLVPTNVNDSADMLFGLDTGAFANIFALRAAQQMGKVHSESRLHVSGLNGQVKNVYTANAELRFGNLRLPNSEMVTFDLASQSRRIGTEVSGFLGFAMLRIIEVKIDYRDGLVDFSYDPKRVSPFMR